MITLFILIILALAVVIGFIGVFGTVIYYGIYAILILSLVYIIKKMIVKLFCNKDE